MAAISAGGGKEEYYYGISGPDERFQPNPIMLELRSFGLAPCRSEHKFVPEAYLLASPEDRLELLRGLMDTDGNGGAASVFNSSSIRLAEAVEFLVRSLGGVTRRSKGSRDTETDTA